MSSGATDETLLRNPYDVINLYPLSNIFIHEGLVKFFFAKIFFLNWFFTFITRASLFGLCEVKAKASVLAQCKHLLLKAGEYLWIAIGRPHFTYQLY